MNPIRAFFANKDQRVSFVIFVCLGILIVAGAYIFAINPIREIGVSIGSVILTIPIISLVWKILGGDPIDRRIEDLTVTILKLEHVTDVIKDCQNVGIYRLIDCAANFGNQRDWMELFENSKEEIDILGRTMFSWIDGTGIDEMILRKTEEGVRIRWLVMAPDNKCLHLIEENDTILANVVSDKIPKVTRFIRNLKSQIPAKNSKRFQVKTFDHVPLYGNLARFDSRYYITPYFYYRSSKNSPLLIVQGKESSWGKIYQAEFDQIWSRSREFEDRLG